MPKMFNKQGLPRAGTTTDGNGLYCEDYVRLKLNVTSKRGRRRMAKVLAPDARLKDHVVLDRTLAGSYTWDTCNLEKVPDSWVIAKESRSSRNTKT